MMMFCPTIHPMDSTELPNNPKEQTMTTTATRTEIANDWAL